MESEQTGLAFSLPLSPEHVRANSPVEFAHDYLYPSPEAHDTVFFGLDDVLLTAASDSEDFRTVLADALPPSGQEARPFAAYSEIVDVLSRATAKLALDCPDDPRESQLSKLDERFLSGPNSRPERRAEGRPARGEWRGEFLSWHINCLELRAVFLALMHFLPVLGKHQIIVRTDNMVVVSHLNHQGGSRSRNVTFPRFRPHRFALRWSHFTLSILVPLLRMRMRGFHALSSSRFEDVCGPLQHLEKILRVAGVFWCWPPWACHIKAKDFSLGERCHFAGLRGAWPSFTSQSSGAFY